MGKLFDDLANAPGGMLAVSCMNCYAGECGCTMDWIDRPLTPEERRRCEAADVFAQPKHYIRPGCPVDCEECANPCPPGCVLCAAEVKLAAHDYDACAECTRIGALDTQQIGCDEWERLFSDYQIACQEIDP